MGHAGEALSKEGELVRVNRSLVLGSLLLAVAMGLAGSAGAASAQKLVVATWQTGAPYLDTLREFGDVRGVEVEIVHLTGGDRGYFEQIVTMSVGGTPPDIMYMKRGLLGDGLQEMGLLEDLNPWVDRDPQVRREDHHPDVMLGAGERFLQFLPVVILERMVGYNLEHVRRSGIAEPEIDWTFDDFREFLRRVTRTAPDGSVELWGHDDAGRIWPYDGPMGLTYFNEQGTEVILDNPKTIEGLEFFRKLINEDQVIAPPGVNARCQNGRSVSCVWNASWFDDREGEWGLVSLPVGPGGKAPLVLIEGYAMHAQSANKELAWELIRWATSDESMMRLVAAGITPAKLPILINHAHLEHPYREALLDTLVHGKRYFAVPQGTVVPYSLLEEAVSIFRSRLSSYWRGQRSLRQILDESVPAMQSMIAQWMSQNLKE